MFVIFLKITIQKDFAAEHHCFKVSARILCIQDTISATLKMLTINANVNSVRARLTKLNIITQRPEI